MQNDPEKYFNNYNEFQPYRSRPETVHQATDSEYSREQAEIIDIGIELVSRKVDGILGIGNKLTDGSLSPPTTDFIEDDPKHPAWAGYFNPDSNKVTVITGRTRDRSSTTKVFIHEYIHFLSHNGRDDNERITNESPIALNNNIGFSRNFGFDIRRGKENTMTNDYFKSFNEAVTEQLAIDIMPDEYETYEDYRGLLNQVIDDVISQGFGAPNEEGIFTPWSTQQTKDYIYKCFFKGDLASFTKLLQNTYKKFNISEQQFGLMTSKHDLPSQIERSYISEDPNNPPPTPAEIAALVQLRIESKTPQDYPTDIIRDDSEADSIDYIKYGQEFDNHVSENRITFSGTQKIEGIAYDIDSQGYIIYGGEKASLILGQIQAEFDELLDMAIEGSITKEQVSDQMDELLFRTYYMSMLSDGFRDFYIYKHSEIDNL